MSNIAFVLGNGESRKGIQISDLKQHGTVFACNGVYRTDRPDFLIAVAPKMMIEIAESCCPETKDNSCSSITENIHFEFQTLINYFSFDFKQAGLLLYVAFCEVRYNDIFFLLYYLMEYVPLDIYNPELSQIQSFLL